MSLGSLNLNAAVTVVGSSDALICYKHAKFGYTTQSSVFTCLKALSDNTISKKIMMLPELILVLFIIINQNPEWP